MYLFTFAGTVINNKGIPKGTIMALLDSLVNNDLVNKFVKSKTESIKNLAGSTMGNALGGLSESSFTSADQYEFNKYDVGSLTYPDDLLGNDQALSSKNYVIFYINVSVDSKVTKVQKAETVEGVTRDLRGALVGQKITEAQAAIANTVSSAIGGSVLGKFLGNDKTAAIGGKLGAAFGAAAVATISPGDRPPAEEKQPEFSRPQKRLKKAIALHMPNNLRTGYRVAWGEKDTMAFQALAGASQQIGEVLQKGGSAESIKSAGTAGGDILKNIALQTAMDGVGIGAGLAANPKKEQEFQGVDFREFSYNYQFAPRDEGEAATVINIIREFKYHMHPEYLESTGFTYVYPSEFDIVFYTGTEQNPFVHKHSSAVLTAMEVDYAPNNVFVTFPNGMPTQINITLTFRELLTITKENIERGL